MGESWEADSLRLGYESRVAELNAQADQVIRKAEAEAFRRREEIVDQGRLEAARIAERNRLQCDADVQAAMLAAKTELLDIAGSLAKQALGKAATPDVEASLIHELSQELKQTEWKK